MALKGNEPKVRCSFCGKPEDKVHKLIAGPDGAYICDECIELCAEILSEDMDEPAVRGAEGSSGRVCDRSG